MTAMNRYVSLRVGIVLFFGFVSLLLLRYSHPHKWLELNPGHTDEPKWLIATMSAASSQRRRNIIRATMGKAYSNPSLTFRFVVSNPGELWAPVIQHENQMYGDIIMLPHLEETHDVAITVKSVEALKYFVNSGQSWRFVSKMDDDSFVALPFFYRRYLEPLTAEDAGIFAPHTVIGRRLQGERPYAYPGGQFYTLSWKTASAIVTQYESSPIVDEDEDVLIGRLLKEAGQHFEVTELPNPEAFDFDAGNGDKWAWSHNITEEAINPHKLKEDLVYLDVAAQMLALHPK